MIKDEVLEFSLKDIRIQSNGKLICIFASVYSI